MQKQITSQIAPKTKTISSEENIDDKNIKFSRNPSNYNSLKIDSEQQYYNYNYDPNQIDIYQNNNNINNSSIDEQSESSDSEDQQNSEKLERQMELEQIQIDELMKQTQTKLYQKAELREKQFIEIQNKIVSQNLNIINVPIKLDKVYPTTKKNIEKENKALLQQDKKKKSNSSKSKCGLSFYKNNKNNSNKYTTKMHYQTTQSSQQLDPETNQNNNKEFQFIHTLEYGENDNPIILLLHGYSGTSVSFISLIEGLSTHFKIYCIDLIGLGLSSRPKFDLEDSNQIIDYFVDSIVQWKSQMNIKSKIYILGHCFGGYIASNYALKHQNQVEKLILINPLGLTKFTYDDIEQILINMKLKQTYFQKKFWSWAQEQFKNKQTPTTLSKKFYIPSNYVLQKFFKQFVHSSDKIAKKYQKYTKRVLQFAPSTQVALNNLFRFPNLAAHISIETLIPQHYRHSSTLNFQHARLYSQVSKKGSYLDVLTSKTESKQSQFFQNNNDVNTSQNQEVQLNGNENDKINNKNNKIDENQDYTNKPNMQQSLQNISEKSPNAQKQFFSEEKHKNLQTISPSKILQQKQVSKFEEQFQKPNEFQLSKNSISIISEKSPLSLNLCRKSFKSNNTSNQNISINHRNSISKQKKQLDLSCASDRILHNMQNNSILSSQKLSSKLNGSLSFYSQNNIQNNNNNQHLLKFQIHIFLGNQDRFITDSSAINRLHSQNSLSKNIITCQEIQGGHQTILNNNMLPQYIIEQCKI